MEVRHVAQDSRKSPTRPSSRLSLLPIFGTLVAVLPVLLSPTHPVGVYAYLADSYVAPLVGSRAQDREQELEKFLIAPKEVDRYRTALRTDMMDRRGGAMFAIVRGPDGGLRR